jgi:hypothetical protein
VAGLPSAQAVRGLRVHVATHARHLFDCVRCTGAVYRRGSGVYGEDVGPQRKVSLAAGLSNPTPTHATIHSNPPPFNIPGSPTNSSFYHAEFDNFEISSASELTCATPGSGTPVSVQWCGEPNTANSQWNFNWTTGLICKCVVVRERLRSRTLVENGGFHSNARCRDYVRCRLRRA